MSQRAQRARTPASETMTDALLAVCVAGSLSLIIALGQSDAGAGTGALPYVFAIGFGAVLLLRRRLPRSVLVLSVLGTFAYYTLELPQIGIAVPLLGALFSAAEAGLLRWAVAAGAVTLAVAQAFRLRDGLEAAGFLLGYETVSNIALIAAAVALGYGIRAVRTRIAQQAQLAALTEAQLAHDAELRVQREREHISRELHDSIGHALSVIALHANVGTEAVGSDDRAAAEALERIGAQSSSSLAELRSMLRLLRSGDDGARDVRSAAGIEALVERASSSDTRIVTDLQIPQGSLPAAVDAAVFRIVQESITNVIRHAHASTAHVHAKLDDGEVRIRVSDDGVGADTGARPGLGVEGLRERVRLLGGTLAITTAPGQGYRLDATIPARLEA